jgi:hypothetical protein
MPHTGMDMATKSRFEAIGGSASWRVARSFQGWDSLTFVKLLEQVECVEL